MAKRNPQEMTLRNTQAANKKIAALRLEIRDLKKRVKALEKRK